MKTVKEVLEELQGGWFARNKKVEELFLCMVTDVQIGEKSGRVDILEVKYSLHLSRVTDAAAKKSGGRWNVAVY